MEELVDVASYGAGREDRAGESEDSRRRERSVGTRPPSASRTELRSSSLSAEQGERPNASKMNMGYFYSSAFRVRANNTIDYKELVNK